MQIENLTSNYYYIGNHPLAPGATITIADSEYNNSDAIANQINGLDETNAVTVSSAPSGYPRSFGGGGSSGGISQEDLDDAIAALSATYQGKDNELTDIAGLADPGADRILFWDDSADGVAFLTPNTGLAVSGTNLNVTSSGALTLIEEIVVGAGGVATVDFQNIPQTYRHLRVEAVAQTEDGSAQYLRGRFNAGATGYYSNVFEVAGTGSSINNEENQTTGRFGIVPETGAAQMVSVVIDIPRYTDAIVHTATCHFAGYWNSQNRHGIASCLRGTAEAITRLEFLPANGDMKQGSVFALYGIS